MTRKIAFFEGWPWFKFNNLGLAPGTNLKFCTSGAKGLKLKVRKFLLPNPTFVEKLVGVKEQPWQKNNILDFLKEFFFFIYLYIYIRFFLFLVDFRGY